MSYNSENIKILKGLDAVRKRPGMYIGSTDINGLHHLLWEIIDNSMDEALANHAKNIKITLNDNDSVTVEDDGRGIPVGKHSSGLSTIEVVFTKLHAGGKFNSDAYKISGGLNGVGASVVNALSDELSVTIYRDGFEYLTTFGNGGKLIKNTKKIGVSSKKGTKITFLPSKSIFGVSKFDYEIISERLRESSFLIKNIKIKLSSKITGQKDVFEYENGIYQFIDFINKSKKSISPIIIWNGVEGDIKFDIAFQYTNTISETIISFVNNVKTKDGGKHVDGFKSAFTKTVNEFVKKQNLLKKSQGNLEGSDIREGITAIISVSVPENMLQFVGQTKDKLGTQDVKNKVESFISKHLTYWLNENKKIADKIIENMIISSKARLAAKKARMDARNIKASKNKEISLSGKLTPAQIKDPKQIELYLVEGSSAGGSAKLGRDRKFQAILPLRGKVINAEKAKLKDIIQNEEIISIIHSIGADFGADFDISKIKYDKIIIMTDADTDGAHIQILLLTFFYRLMRPLIEQGKIYVALPPLYKVTISGKKIIYAWNDHDLRKIINANKNTEIQRYKGLGEMNSDQLWDTTMNPETRTLIKISIDDLSIAERRITTLMGDNVLPRREWIEKNIKFINDDKFLKTIKDSNE